MIKFKKIGYNIFVYLVLISNSLCCYGNKLTEEKISIVELPAYFSIQAWSVIEKANEQDYIGDEKVIAIMDGPVEYIAGLEGRNNEYIQKTINGSNFFSDSLHGTAVAGLIASKPSKLLCRDIKNFTSKNCDEKEEVVVAGIAQNIQIVNFPSFSSSSYADEYIKNLVSKLTNQNENKDIRTSRKSVPEIVILNFSLQPKTRKGFLQELIKIFQEQQKPLVLGSDSYTLFQWLIKCANNDGKWVEPTSNFFVPNVTIPDYENYLKIFITVPLEANDIAMKRYDKAIRTNILSKKSTFILVVAAGNESEKLENNKYGYVVRIGDERTKEDPVIVVAAGCGKDYKEVCSFSNYGNTSVDILAPGKDIPVMVPLKDANGEFISFATYAQGTSFSSPIVAGVIALLAQCNPNASAEDIKEAIFENADKYPDLAAKIIDGKVLNVKKTVDFMCKIKGNSHPKKPKKKDQELLHEEL